MVAVGTEVAMVVVVRAVVMVEVAMAVAMEVEVRAAAVMAGVVMAAALQEVVLAAAAAEAASRFESARSTRSCLRQESCNTAKVCKSLLHQLTQQRSTRRLQHRGIQQQRSWPTAW